MSFNNYYQTIIKILKEYYLKKFENLRKGFERLKQIIRFWVNLEHFEFICNKRFWKSYGHFNYNFWKCLR